MPVRPHFQKLVERVRPLPPLPAAVVFPCDRDALQTALSAAFAGYLEPTLVGPEARIRDAADRAGLDIARLPVVDTPDDPRAASVRAALLARDGRVAALVKGSLTHEALLAPVADPASGLRTGRRLSHAYFVDVATAPRGLLLTDAQLNLNPNLPAKQDIVHNAVLLAHALGIEVPNVAVLAAMDGPSPGLRSTADAAALKSMAQQGLFGSARVDGPFTPDSALSADIARQRSLAGEVAGRADVVVAPSMESAVMMVRTMLAVGNGLGAGLVLGASVPIVASLRHDPIEVRVAACVLASLVHAARAKATATAAAPGPAAARVAA